MSFIRRFRERYRFGNDARIIEQIDLENIHNLYYVGICIIIFELIAITSYVAANGKNLRVIGQVFFCIISCAIVTLMARNMKHSYERGGRISNRRVNIILTLFYILMSAWGILVDTYHYIHDEQMLTFYIVQFCFGVFILLLPRLGTVLFAIGFCVFYGTLRYIDGGASVQPQNLLTFFFIMVAAGHVRYGSKYREITESNERQSVSAEISQMKDYEKLVNEGIKSSLVAEKPEDNINAMLQFLGEMFDGDRAYIFEKNERNEDDNTFEWCAQGVTPQIEVLQNVPPEVCALWYRTFKKKRSVVIADIEAIRESDPLVYETLKPQQVTSLISFALYENRKIIGFFGIDNPSVKYMDITEDILEIISNFLTSLLRKRNLVRQLQRLSYTDAVTGAENRFAMYTHFEKLKQAEQIGVAFCDITGLKAVNDTEGHGAGDILIQQTYRCLVKHFDKTEVFRISGDEFVVLCSGIPEKAFADKVMEMRTDLQENHLTVAIGTQFLPRVAESIDKTIEKAEKNMYIEKSDWYKQSGKERRRGNS